MDHILLFRMGDFYEVFFEDAAEASKRLNITLTHRGKIGDMPIPMAGIPHHAAAVYVDRLSNQGLKIAICEQIQDPKEAKGIVQRAVTQVVSPGMPFDLDKTESSEHRFMASAIEVKDGYYLITLDFTTGEFKGLFVQDKEELLDRIQVIAPKEFISYMGQWEKVPEMEVLFDHLGILPTFLSEEYFESKHTEIYTEKLIRGFKRDKVISSHKNVLKPIGALAYYVLSTQQLEEFCHIRPFQLIDEKGNMKASLHTLTGLEILPKAREGYKDSLLGFMDKTQTAMGTRSLKTLFMAPLRDREQIEKRLELVTSLLNDGELLNLIREEFTGIRDIERILAKVSTNKATAADLINLSQAIKIYGSMKKSLDKLINGLWTNLKPKEFKALSELSETIDKTINDEIGASLDKGNLIRPGCHKKRDRLAKLSNNASEELSRLEERYREETGIPKLRVKSNNVAGYFIEVSKTHTNKVPKHFERRQTLVNSERYMTEELSAFEKEMISAKEKLERLEREIFKDIIWQVSEHSLEIHQFAKLIGLIDSYQSLTWIAKIEEFNRPEIQEEKGTLLKGAWHPLIKSSIEEQFVPHDLSLSKDQFFGLITGPNMAGKTTVMREVAIIQTLTQIGSYVPAASAKVSLCDYLFSRLGASDDILKGQSTFMVEMAETAEIIRHSTENSLIILDEVGRGTSTYDGLSIAWSLVEYLVNKTKAQTLFATHYHELIDLADQLVHAKNLTVETMNHNGEVQFLYRLVEKGASQSFGIYVAKLAGLPPELLRRSEEILHQLESDHKGTEVEIKANNSYKATQLSFFPEQQEVVPEYLKKLEEEIKDLDVNKMTPIQALNQLDELKKQVLN